MAKAKKAKAKPAKAKAKPAKAKAKKPAKPAKRAVRAKAKKKPSKSIVVSKPGKSKKAARAKAKAAAPAKAKAPAKPKPVQKLAKVVQAKPRPPAKPAVPALEALALETIVLASPDRVYAAWLDGTEHSAFTGGEAIIDAVVGGKHSAWSGYIEGRFLDLEPGRRISMTWRTTEFEENDADSRCEVRFSPDGGGTRIQIEHTDLPPGGAQKYGTGWREFYFVPMRRYFETGDATPS